MRRRLLVLVTPVCLLACGAPKGATGSDSEAASSTGDGGTGSSGDSDGPATGSSGDVSSDAGTGSATDTGAPDPTTGSPATGTDPSTGDDTGDDTTGDDTTGDPVACPADALAAGDHTLEISHGGMMRSAIVHVPPGLDPQQPAPLVLNFHGFTMTAAGQVAFTGMNPVADAEGFVVVYPDGYMNSWNAGACCGNAAAQGIDDVGFVRALVEELHARLCIDAARVYATGMSNGGFMSHRLACEAADLVAAVAPVSCINGMDPCAPSRPVPVMMFNGTADLLIDYEGGVFYDKGAQQTFAEWAERDGCAGGPTAGASAGAATSERHDACDAGAQVVLWTIEGMGHCWPGQPTCAYGTPNEDLDANAEMWAFLEQFTLP